MILTKVARPLNKIHTVMITAMVLGMAFCLFFARGLFGIYHLTVQSVMLLVVFLIATEGIFRYIYKFTGAVGRGIQKMRKGRRKTK